MAVRKSQIPGPSQRQLRVGELVRRCLSEVFTRGDVYHQGLADVTLTITEVRMSPDLKHAFAFVCPLGKPLTKELKEALKQEMPKLRSHIGRSLRLKYTPELHFEEDTSFDEAQKINRLLESPKVAQDLKS